MKFFLALLSGSWTPISPPRRGSELRGCLLSSRHKHCLWFRGKQVRLGATPGRHQLAQSIFFALVLTSILSYGSHAGQGLAAWTLKPQPKALHSWTREAGAQVPWGAGLGQLLCAGGVGPESPAGSGGPWLESRWAGPVSLPLPEHPRPHVDAEGRAGVKRGSDAFPAPSLASCWPGAVSPSHD